MRLEQTDTVDYLGIEKGTGHIILTLVDEADWTNERRHLELLQAKVNRYLDFIESGEVFQEIERIAKRPVAAMTPIEISILAKFEPTDEGRRFWKYAKEFIERNAGATLTFKFLPPQPADAG